MFVSGFLGLFGLGRAWGAFGFATEAVLLRRLELSFERGDFGSEFVDDVLKVLRLGLQIADHRLERGDIVGQGCVGFQAELWMTIGGCASGKLRLRSRIPPMPLGGGEVDAIENPGKLRGGEFDLRVAGRGKMVSAAFESLTPQAQSVGTPIQDFESIGGSIREYEQVATERIGVQGRLHVAEQAVESEPQIDGSAVPQSGRGRQAQHERVSTEAMSAASCSGE